jgi:hypothetical protein
MENTDEASNDQPYQGKELGGASAAISSGLKPRFWRYARYDASLRFVLTCDLVIGLIAAACFGGGYALRTYVGGWFGAVGVFLYVLGVLAALLAILIALLIVWYFHNSTEYFEHALLTPGMVLSRDPLVVVVLAPMGNGSGPEYYGIARRDLKALPFHQNDRWTRVPCVSRFAPKDGLDRWSFFLSEIVSHGTGDPKEINQCFERLGDEPFRQLEELIHKGTLPKTEEEIVLLDENLNYIETLDKKTAMTS